MKGWIARYGTFWGLLILWLLIGGLLIVATERRELHLTLNAWNVHGRDGLFMMATWLGDRRVAWAAGLVLCFWRVRWGITVLAAVIAAGLATETLKYGVLGPVPRPVAYFGEPTPLYLVPGFTNKLTHSMPSGHAAITFALFTALALGSRSRLLQGACFVVALISAYSRVYLSEHFLEDIYAGSLLGVVCAVTATLVAARVRPTATQEAGDTTGEAGGAAEG